ncbi:MAG: nucleotidyltransferase family protein [Anaerolineae bacterium]|nr:nucleotidyltransferase family protein [Anaerolineae bacterium]
MITAEDTDEKYTIDHQTLHPGEKLLHLILRGRWDRETLEEARALAARDGVAWDDFLQAARAEGVSPIVYDAVRGQGLLPAQIEESLRLDYYGVAKINLLRFHRLEEVLRCLADEEINVILLKGAALAQAVYSNLALRPMGDFDLLVHEEDVDGALRVLAALGYEQPYGEFRPGFIRAFRNQIMMSKAGDAETRPIEIHWRLLAPLYYQRTIPTGWLWQTARAARLGTVPVRVLSPEAQVLHLCGHLLQHGGCGRANARQLYDLAEVIVLYREQIDWDQILARARAYDLVLPLQEALSRAHAMWSLPIPPGVWERLQHLRPSRGEERAYALLVDGDPVARQMWSGLASISGWGLRLRYVWGNLFPSADYMLDQYRIPSRLLLPLYYPYRWLRGLRRAR